MRLMLLAAMLALTASSGVATDPPAVLAIKGACRSVCASGLTAREVAHLVGTITVDHGDAAQVEFKVKDTTFPEGEVIRDGVSHRPVSVRLYVKDALNLPLSGLVGSLGKLEQARRRLLNGNTSVVFESPIEGASDCACRVSAEVSTEKQVDTAAVKLITVSRGER